MLYFIKSGNYCKIGYTKDRKALVKDLLNKQPFFSDS